MAIIIIILAFIAVNPCTHAINPEGMQDYMADRLFVIITTENETTIVRVLYMNIQMKRNNKLLYIRYNIIHN